MSDRPAPLARPRTPLDLSALRPKTEVFADYVERVRPLKAVRSTLIVSAVAALDEAGYSAPYRRAMPEPHRSTVLESVAATWMELETVRAHYAALQALDLPVDQQMHLGSATGRKVQGTLLGTAVRMANGAAGVTPWTLLAQVGRFWGRAYDGSALRILRCGPKEAIAEIAHNEIMERFHYPRNALRGFTASIFSLFCQRMWMREQKVGTGLVTFRIQWV